MGLKFGLDSLVSVRPFFSASMRSFSMPRINVGRRLSRRYARVSTVTWLSFNHSMASVSTGIRLARRRFSSLAVSTCCFFSSFLCRNFSRTRCSWNRFHRRTAVLTIGARNSDISVFCRSERTDGGRSWSGLIAPSDRRDGGCGIRTPDEEPCLELGRGLVISDTWNPTWEEGRDPPCECGLGSEYILPILPAEPGRLAVWISAITICFHFLQVQMEYKEQITIMPLLLKSGSQGWRGRFNHLGYCNGTCW